MSAERNILRKGKDRVESPVDETDAFSQRHAVRIDGKEVIVLAVAQDTRMADA